MEDIPGMPASIVKKIESSEDVDLGDDETNLEPTEEEVAIEAEINKAMETW